VRVVEEQLPGAAAHALGWEAPQFPLDLGLLQLGNGAGQVGRGERHVVDHASAVLMQFLAVDHMQDRLVADPEPIAGKLEIWPLADLEAEQVAVELPRLLEVVAQHGEVVHALNAHSISPLSGPSIRDCGLGNILARKWPKRRAPSISRNSVRY